MVHLTYNAIERRKSACTCKIWLYVRYHSETPCKVCPNQRRIYPETPQRIPRGLYHAIMPQQIGTARTDHAKPEQLVTVSPRRIFRGSPVRGVCAGSQLPYLSCQRSAFCVFLRIFQPNCTKLLLCAITKTTKTAYLLAFCKHAAFLDNFCR